MVANSDVPPDINILGVRDVLDDRYMCDVRDVHGV